MQDKMERGRVRIDWLTCDDHWSNPLSTSTTLIKNRVGDDGVPAILQYRPSDYI